MKGNNPQHRFSAPDAPPILMVTSRYDLATPYDWNIAAHRQLKSSVLLHYDGVGHGHYGLPCPTEYMNQYLTTLATPPKNTHCEAQWPVSEQALDDGDLLDLPARPPRWQSLPR